MCLWKRHESLVYYFKIRITCLTFREIMWQSWKIQKVTLILSHLQHHNVSSFVVPKFIILFSWYCFWLLMLKIYFRNKEEGHGKSFVPRKINRKVLQIDSLEHAWSLLLYVNKEMSVWWHSAMQSGYLSFPASVGKTLQKLSRYLKKKSLWWKFRVSSIHYVIIQCTYSVSSSTRCLYALHSSVNHQN